MKQKLITLSILSVMVVGAGAAFAESKAEVSLAGTTTEDVVCTAPPRGAR